MEKVRTRFAPSPTGFLHVGGMRTALFAWLLARQNNGNFILRIEDTDKSREVSGSIEHIIKCLSILGLNYDEGPDKPGPYGPYRQSERLNIYLKWAERLVSLGRAYPDPYSNEQLNAFREDAAKAHQPFLYRNHRPVNPHQWDGKSTLRFKSDPKVYKWHDLVMGDLSAGEAAIDDFVLIKADGYPTYNFAHIVDDSEMQISHVMRGNEFIASTPNYLNLYEAYNLTPPQFATPPHILNPAGNKKLSKRDGAKDILDYLDEGYLKEALINFIASLGWNDGTTKEFFSLADLINDFSLERIQKSGARFDERRLLWMNGHYIRESKLNELFEQSEPYWPKEAKNADREYRIQVLELVRERLKYLAELAELTRFFFVDLPLDSNLISNSPKLSSLTPVELKELLTQTRLSLSKSDFTTEDLTDRLNQLLETTKQVPATLFSLIRIATTQAPASPPLAETMSLLGKQRVLERIDQQLAAL